MNKTAADELAALTMQGQKRPMIVAVASGKGGVGKTNISANLAVALAAAGKKVALFDADLGLANLDIILGISGKYNLSHFLSGAKNLDQICQNYCPRLDVICGLCGIENLANINDFARERLLASLQSLTDDYDIVIVDTAAGIGKNVLAFCMAADHTIAVSTTEPAAITDAYTLIKVLTLKKYSGRISLLVNMAENVSEGKRVYHQVSMAASQFLNIKLNHCGILLKDSHIASAVKKRRPFVLEYPKCSASASLVAIAAKLTRTAVGFSQESFFKKVVNWLF